MAAITATAAVMGVNKVRAGTAQATTGQTDWLAVPSNAKYALVQLNLTAVAGTTPTMTPSFLTADPYVMTDTAVPKVAEHAAVTAITTAGFYNYQLGPGITGIADDTTQAANAASYVSLNVVLPPILGIKILNDRADADETYTYNLSVTFR